MLLHWREKLKAFTLHLLISVLVITLFLLVISQFWYPEALFKLENAWQGLQILIPVDAILGPLLTLIVFVPGKKSLKLDLSIIAALQVSALIYGGILIYQQRPIALAFVIDRFETVLASESYASDIPLERFKDNKNSPLLTFVLPAQSVKEKSQFLLNGVNIKKRGERHYPIIENIELMKKVSIQPASLTLTTQEEKNRLAEFMKSYQSNKALLLFPVQSSTYDAVILVLDSNTGVVDRYLDIYPWP